MSDVATVLAALVKASDSGAFQGTRQFQASNPIAIKIEPKGATILLQTLIGAMQAYHIQAFNQDGGIKDEAAFDNFHCLFDVALPILASLNEHGGNFPELMRQLRAFHQALINRLKQAPAAFTFFYGK